jgi:hypothetical protein
MSSGPTGWLPLILTTFGAGVAGSLIATYGGQSRERRKARSEAMASLQKLETARLTRPVIKGFNYDDQDMAELSARCILAGVPQYLVSLYQFANEAPRYLGTPHDGPARPSVELAFDEAREMLASALIEDAAVLLARALWHPWLSAFFRRRRARKTRDIIIRAFPGADYPAKQTRAWAISEWESTGAEYREWLSKGKREGNGEDRPEDKPEPG